MNKIESVIVKVCDVCNFNCTYCFEGNKGKNVFTQEKELLSLLKTLEFEDKVRFRFFGGEMFLYPDRVESIYKEIKKIERYKETQFEFGFITNGSIINDKMIKMFNRNIFTMRNSKISWDGIHSSITRKIDKRSSDFDEYMRNNILLLSQWCGEDVLVSMAILPENIHTLYDSYKFIRKYYNSFEYYLIFDINNLYRYEDKDFLFTFKQELKNIFMDYKQWICQLHNYELFKGTYNYSRCDSLGRQLYIHSNGDIYSCALLKEMDTFSLSNTKIGSLNDNTLDLSISENIKNNVYIDENSYCKDCNYKKFCSTCPLEKQYFKDHCDHCPIKKLRQVEYEVFSEVV